MEYHKPVLLKEVIENLGVEKGKKYIDATLGDAGHTIEILKLGGEVLGLEINEVGLERALGRIKEEGLEENFIGVCGNFKNIEEIAKENGFDEVSGIIYDLGYSSFELEGANLGLSFQKDEPLDMRLDSSLGVSAADLINSLSEKELTSLLFTYSQEKLSKKIAKAIIEARKLEKIQTTSDLVKIIESVTSPDYERGRINPATRTFQALRIVVNDEITNLEKSLPRAARILLPGSKILVISFHSLEDKVAKEFGRSARLSVAEVTERPILPSDEEIEQNPRARSAKLRVFEKIK
jgi:16S rRNA (cytosine1402-N4)-methyltransferase